MAGKYYLGIDQGTTGITAVLLDESWRLVARGYSEIRTFYPQPGWVEHDPAEVCEKAEAVAWQALSAAGLRENDEIACVGIAHEGESVVLWDKVTGRPVYNVIVWQDRRTARCADELRQEHGERIREKTGLAPDSYFSATKIRWTSRRL